MLATQLADSVVEAKNVKQVCTARSLKLVGQHVDLLLCQSISPPLIFNFQLLMFSPAGPHKAGCFGS